MSLYTYLSLLTFHLLHPDSALIGGWFEDAMDAGDISGSEGGGRGTRPAVELQFETSDAVENNDITIMLLGQVGNTGLHVGDFDATVTFHLKGYTFGADGAEVCDLRHIPAEIAHLGTHGLDYFIFEHDLLISKSSPSNILLLLSNTLGRKQQ